MVTRKKIDALVESAIAHELKHNPDNEPVVVRLIEPTIKVLEPSRELRKWCVLVFCSRLGFQIPIKKTKSPCSRVEWKNGHVSLFTSI